MFHRKKTVWLVHYQASTQHDTSNWLEGSMVVKSTKRGAPLYMEAYETVKSHIAENYRNTLVIVSMSNLGKDT